MNAIDTRSVKRDSLFLTAELTLADGGQSTRVKVRNLSDGGMMAEADLYVERGMRLAVDLRNVGRVTGSVAWTQDNRFGIVFDNEIDSKKVREAPAPAVGPTGLAAFDPQDLARNRADPGAPAC